MSPARRLRLYGTVLIVGGILLAGIALSGVPGTDDRVTPTALGIAGVAVGVWLLRYARPRYKRKGPRS